MTERRLSLIALLLATALAGCGAGPPDGTGSGADAGAVSGVTGIRYLAAGAGGDGSDGGDRGDGPDDGDAADDGANGFARALEPRAFRFPADHAAHPDFRTEWWYFTGNLFDAGEGHYGFELTVFRIALSAVAPARASALASNEIWMGHLAVTDTAGRRFYATERLSRGADGLAGATMDSAGAVVVRIEDWSIRLDGDDARLNAAGDDFGIALELTGLERIVAQGERGLDPKGPEPGNASYYFSAPRLAVTGELQAGGATRTVTGTAWMDREWSTSALSADLAGWDWFALQLSDGRDLMFYRLRERGGGTSAFSGGSLSTAAGQVTPLTADDVILRTTREWTSPASGVRYPVAWELAIPSAGLELSVRPRLDAQELNLTVRYWEGAVAVSGSAAGRAIDGVGYLELAGY